MRRVCQGQSPSKIPSQGAQLIGWPQQLWVMFFRNSNYWIDSNYRITIIISHKCRYPCDSIAQTLWCWQLVEVMWLMPLGDISFLWLWVKSPSAKSDARPLISPMSWPWALSRFTLWPVGHPEPGVKNPCQLLDNYLRVENLISSYFLQYRRSMPTSADAIFGSYTIFIP